MTFTAQKVINAARQRHPALAKLVLDDQQLIDDYNRLTDEVLAVIMSVDELVLMQKSTAITFTGADGSIVDLDLSAAGDILKIVEIDALTAGGDLRVVLKDFRHRGTVVADYADDTRPVASIVWNAGVNRWDLYEWVNWSAVTGVEIFGIIQPAQVTSLTLTTIILLPQQVFLPLVERFALLLGQRADLDDSWVTLQNQAVKRSFQAMGSRFKDFALTSQMAQEKTVGQAQQA